MVRLSEFESAALLLFVGRKVRRKGVVGLQMCKIMRNGLLLMFVDKIRLT